ncbi:conjugal transfer protein MobC [Algoriphagus yeomjeoni]|uniref:Type IV secretory system conjugative DNA transfer VirD4/TraG family protein n=1 Tax=Algoriphagus yeomjeoni TaxID=291403 RepID=A0A327P6S8_9BACT|nr:conjugal transfer protein MobC [Algoriphagus yeomjeoni]RAI86784.1 type IV secretory system conjugative DNA transfer VirD4/TraG family protein [Algoriphagus yeomjeoni]
MQTGENTEGLRKIIDLTRKASIGMLCLHCYYYCYHSFDQWGLTHPVSERLLVNIRDTGVFNEFYITKAFALGLLLISLIGAKGKKDDKLRIAQILWPLICGLLIYAGSFFVFLLPYNEDTVSIIYIAITSLGFILILRGGALLSRLLKNRFDQGVFNHLNETFPQEERCLENEYSVNLPAQYRLKDKVRKSWINIINPFRALLVAGTPGSGKSYFVIRHVITQHISKGFSMFVYDFKYDDLSRIAYNTLQKNLSAYRIKPKFYTINFDRLSHTHRCNPLEPDTMLDITDASEAARTIMLGLNREWIKKQGDFFVESPINFLTAIVWFLKKHRQGKYCTLPHVIELMQVEYEKLFTVLRTEPEIEVLVNPFVSALVKKAFDQLEGQVASAKITMARLSSPQLYYVLSESEFTLDLNKPDEPKIICMGNNPQKQQVHGAVLSLYISRIVKLVNQKGKLKSSLVFDEFPTIYFNGIDNLIATARSNKVATCLGVQDYSQLRKDYGREQADVIMNTVGNFISGQVLGDTAKQLSERFGRIIQNRESISINSSETSVSKSTQLDQAVPSSRISSLSSGEFVGMVADTPDQKIELKAFHSEIINDHKALKQEEESYRPIPKVRDISQEDVEENYRSIKREVEEIIRMEMERVLDTPELGHLIIRG